jgi:hypothetical protein
MHTPNFCWPLPLKLSSTQHRKVRTVSPAQDQAECQTCTAFAVAAAAETAMAAALQVDVQQCSISVQALFFCVPDEPTRSCEAGWSLRDALQQLQQRRHKLPTASCLPYKPDMYGDQRTEALCKGQCHNPSTHAGRGKLSSQMITSVWRAQQHIRQYGAVVSRFDVSAVLDSCLLQPHRHVTLILSLSLLTGATPRLCTGLALAPTFSTTTPLHWCA